MAAVNQKKEAHSLVAMRDPIVAHQVLNRSGRDEVHLCPCCSKEEDGRCPHASGTRPAGPCNAFVLDEKDVTQTERRIYRLLGAPI